METFLSQVKVLSAKCHRLTDYLDQLKNLYEKKTQSALSESQEESVDKKIKAVTSLFNGESKKIKEELDLIEGENEKYKESNLVYQARVLQWKNLSKKLLVVLDDYRNTQLNFNRSEKERLEHEYLIANPTATKEDARAYMGKNNKESVFGASSIKSKLLLERIERRHANILAISQAAVEINELIETSRGLVYAQQEMVDKIEITIDRSKKHTVKAKADLESALANQRRINMFKKIFYTIGAVIVGGIVLYIGVKVAAK